MLVVGLLIEAARRSGRLRTSTLARNASLPGLFSRNLLLGNARRACCLFGRRQSDECRERPRRGWSSRRGWCDGRGLDCARCGPGGRLPRPLLFARAFESDGLRGPERPCPRLILHDAWAGTARTQHRVRPDQGGNHHDTGNRAVPCKPQRPGFLRSVHGTGPTALHLTEVYVLVDAILSTPSVVAMSCADRSCVRRDGDGGIAAPLTVSTHRRMVRSVTPPAAASSRPSAARVRPSGGAAGRAAGRSPASCRASGSATRSARR